MLVVMTIILLVRSDDAEEDVEVDGVKMHNPSVATVILTKLPQYINLLVVIAVVSIPEGLPLTVGVALAFSVLRMFKDKLLVKKLDAPEKMGGIDEICCGKTGTITEGKMKVASFYCEQKSVKNSRKDTLLNCELNPETLQRIQESILYNCEASIQMADTTFVPVGNGIDTGLIRLLQECDIPTQFMIKQKLGRIQAVSAFNPENKRSATALSCKGREGTVTVYLKGAPDTVIPLCSYMLTPQNPAAIEEDERQNLQEKVIAMAQQPLKVMTLAYAEIDQSEWEQSYLNEEVGANQSLENAIQEGRLNFIFIGLIGLKDPIRLVVPSSIRYAQSSGNLGIRMVSGDHIETARKVALQAGIIKAAEAADPNSVMLASEFREAVGGIQSRRDEETGQTVVELENREAFKDLAGSLKVLARATAHDKYLLVTGLRTIGKNVSVTGDGINDLESLQAANVGLAMGSGQSIVKHSADLILTNDNFEANLKGIMWGRNIYQNIGKFLKFQITVNLSILFTILIGVCMFAESPINPAQLLWINLIMDTFAALALSTEPPLPAVLEQEPYKGSTKILSKQVWKQIFVASLWNMIVMSVLVFFGQSILGLEYELHTSVAHSEAKKRHFTYIFNVFFFLQLFNEINCRKVGKMDFNVFEGFGHNPYYLLVIFGTSAFQFILTQYFSVIAITVPMDRNEWGACIFMGSTVLLVSAIGHILPDSLFEKIPVEKFINEDDIMDNKVLKVWKNEQSSDSDKYQKELEEDPKDDAKSLDHSGDKFEQAP
uniref:Cation-transporting P-type ATPase C-terminal domain-containing protein n=1 Tax=Strombidium rassoulzadegani TaxID=1082188 RepID=A0A7S3CL09_9SPIT|mmetsp:Transcript_1476/g.2596  ORF Transcript_1476/g.2596 Transcript_1476/m.2596 type:complete len:774 (+) Transcript_1476:971-3292(+)